AWVMARPEVDKTFVAIGGFGGGEVNAANIFVTLKPRRERTVTQQKFMQDMRQELNKIPSLRVTIQDLSQQGFTAQRGYPVEFSVRGSDWDVLGETAVTIMERMRSSPNFV